MGAVTANGGPAFSSVAIAVVNTPKDREECLECSCLDAELVDTGGGPGRFSGYRNLRPVLAIHQVLSQSRWGIAAGRVLRRWYRAKRLTNQISVQRVERATGHVRYRYSRKRKQRLRGGRGRLSAEQRCGLRFHFAAVYQIN